MLTVFLKAMTCPVRLLCSDVPLAVAQFSMQVSVTKAFVDMTIKICRFPFLHSG